MIRGLIVAAFCLFAPVTALSQTAPEPAQMPQAERKPAGLLLGGMLGGAATEEQQPEDVPPGVSGYPIGWSNRLYASFEEALAADKLLGVLFTEDQCAWCIKLADVINTDSRFEAFKNAIVFVAVDPYVDEDDKGNAGRLQTDLAADRRPTLVLLEVSADALVERGRIVGYFPADAFIANLGTLVVHR